MVIASRNPVHSVLFLILAFFNAAGLFVLLGAEFLAMILVVVYVGAVAVLFLFVVMMLDIDFADLKRGALQYLPIGGMVGLAMATELILFVALHWAVAPGAVLASATPANVGNTRRARAHPLYGLHLLFPDRGPGAAGRDDRRHRADLAPPSRRAPPVDRGAERTHAADGDGPGRREARGRARDGDRARTIPFRRGGALHHRRVRHLPEPQERDRHPDVDRADPARGEHQLRRVLRLPARSGGTSVRDVRADRRRRRGPRSGSRSWWFISATAAPSPWKTST